MPMIKKGASGRIEELVVNGEAQPQAEPLLEWKDKDVLVVPTRSETSIDVDLDEEDGDEIAIKA